MVAKYGKKTTHKFLEDINESSQINGNVSKSWKGTSKTIKTLRLSINDLKALVNQLFGIMRTYAFIEWREYYHLIKIIMKTLFLDDDYYYP